MPRKAKILKNTPFTAEMAETYFTAIKSDFDDLRAEVNEKFLKQDQKLNMVLDIVKVYDIEKKEIKVNLWEHDRRIIKLEKQLA